MKLPQLRSAVPSSGNVVSKAIGRFMLFILRWKVIGEVYNVPKIVIVAAPHTSWTDFWVCLATKLALGLHASWLIADTYTKWPVGYIIRWLGGIPVNRRGNNNLVSSVVSSFNAQDGLVLGILPEGTRKKVTKWKSGFWYIAREAGVPIQLASLDYDKRAFEFGLVIETTENKDSDMKKIQNYYKSVTPRHPSKFGGEYLN